jgi:transcriptional regulator with XRE-family HTH domain
MAGPPSPAKVGAIIEQAMTADHDNRLGEFLRARRALVSPQDAGIAPFGRRRVAGLRREELALLAGVSADYYVRLEQGRDRHPSEQVLEALARVLRLDDVEAGHLHELVRPAPRQRRTRARREVVRPGLVALIASWAHTPAFVLGRCMDVLALNDMALALYPALAHERNMIRLVFLHPGAREMHPAWGDVARETVATLRGSADPSDPRLAELVGELSVASPHFSRLWARHDVGEKSHGTKRFAHPQVGELTLSYEAFADRAAPGQVLVVYHAQPGSDSERALALLGTLSYGVRSAVD